MIRVALAGTGSTIVRLGDVLAKTKDFHIVASLSCPTTINSSLWTMEYERVLESRPDIILLSEYRRIFPIPTLATLVLNIHAGVLPKWRGFHANAWALLNGENEIGFTIHEVSERFDAGPIYYVGRIRMRDTDLYTDVHAEMLDSIIHHAPRVMKDAFLKKILPIEQDDSEALYCAKIIPEDGAINSFALPSMDLWNLYRCMAKPLGTGVYTFFKDRIINIGSLMLPTNGRPYRGICGTVVNIESNGIWVKTGDSTIGLFQLSDRTTGKHVSEIRIGSRLGKTNQMS